MIEIIDEILYFLQLYNTTGDEFKNLVVDTDAVENVVADTDYYALNDSNAGAMGNVLEFERRLARFFLLMLNFDEAVGAHMDNIADDWLGNPRPKNYTDDQYYEYVFNNILAFKESAYSIISILQPLSSEPVLILEEGNWSGNMFLKVSYFGYYYMGRTAGGDLITPAILAGDTSEGTGDFYFRVKIQPISAVAEILIIKYLKIAHVAGVDYDITYYSTPAWH